MNSKWLSDDYWLCTNHVPAPQLPCVQETCYYCGNTRPDGMRVKKPFKPIILPGASKPTRKAVKIAKVQTQIAYSNSRCGWSECENLAAPKSKYCSRNCSNKNARAQHASRKVQTKSSPPQSVETPPPSGEKEITPSILPPTPPELLPFDESIFPPAKAMPDE